MMDCSEEVQCVSEEPGAQMELKKGMSIFIDVSKTFFKNLYFICHYNAYTEGSFWFVIKCKNLSMNV